MSYLALIVVYSIAQIALGVWVGRRVRTSSDFFVAGRTLGPGLLFATMLAANIGAGSTVGATGLGYRDGLAAFWWVGSAAVGSLVLAFWVGPAIRRAAAAHDLRTVGDFLELRYGLSARMSMAVLVWVGAVFILAGQLIAVAWILNVVVALPKGAGCVLAGVVITIYFTAGGLLTSAWVNVVQLTVKLIGFAIALPMALAAVGGWATVRALHPSPEYWNPWSSGASGLVYLAMLGPAFIVSPGLLQKVYGARDDRAVRLGVGANAIGLLAYAIVPVVMGMVARARFPDLPARELALPMVLMYGVPPVVGAVGLAAVFSAEMSAADAVLFMLTTSLAQDLYKRFVNPNATDAQVLRMTRITAAIAGTLGVAVALVAASVVDALSVFYTLITVGLFVPIVAAVYSARAAALEALTSMAAGVATVAALQVWTGGTGLAGLRPPILGLTAAIVAFAIVWVLRQVGAGRGQKVSTASGS